MHPPRRRQLPIPAPFFLRHTAKIRPRARLLDIVHHQSILVVEGPESDASVEIGAYARGHPGFVAVFELDEAGGVAGVLGFEDDVEGAVDAVAGEGELVGAVADSRGGEV